MSSQHRLESLIEVVLNTAIGFCIAFAAWPAVAALMGYEYTHTANLTITGIFTVISIARGYVIRRFFANNLHQLAVRTARRILAWR